MHWFWRLRYVIALPLAVAPPLLSPKLTRPLFSSHNPTERAGLTLGTDREKHVIVTSLRVGGPADHGGMAVGDELLTISGKPVTSLARSRRLIEAPGQCNMRITAARAGVQYVATLSKCAR